jgi:hypothetical protein
MRDTIGHLIAKGLGGRRVGGDWMARCPAHDDRAPSLLIRELVHSFAGGGR